MSFSSDHSWSTSEPLWNFNDMFERSQSGPQDASFSAVPMCPPPNSLYSWLDPSLFEESGGLHTANENIDGTNSFPYTDSLNEECRITLKDASTHLGVCGQTYTPSTTIATTTGFVNRNGIGHAHVPQYNKLSSSANINQTDSALNTRSSDAHLGGFRDGAGLLPSNVSSLRYTHWDNNGTNAPIMHNHNLMDPNAYSRVLGLNTVPQASTYPLPPHGPAFWQLNSSPLALPPPTANVLWGQSMQSRLPIHPNTLGGSYVPFAYTNSLAIDATNQGVDYQHSQTTSKISPTTRHTVSAVMPYNEAPSTSEEPSSVELVPRRTTSVSSDVKQNSEPSPTSPSFHRLSQIESSPAAMSDVNSLVSVRYTNTEANSTPNPETSNPDQVPSSISKKNAIRKKGLKQTRRRQLYPSQDLWVKTKDGRYACRYNGPATSEPCTAIISTPRNLGRHMREVHAHQEMKLKIPDSERIAVNGMPDGLRTTLIVCPYSEEDLDKCRYYREEGRRWEIKAMNRGANFLRQHILCYHREEV